MTTQQIRIGIDPEILKWLDEQVESRAFYHRRHGIEFALKRLKTQWEKQEKRLGGKHHA